MANNYNLVDKIKNKLDFSKRNNTVMTGEPADEIIVHSASGTNNIKEQNVRDKIRASDTVNTLQARKIDKFDSDFQHSLDSKKIAAKKASAKEDQIGRNISKKVSYNPKPTQGLNSDLTGHPYEETIPVSFQRDRMAPGKKSFDIGMDSDLKSQDKNNQLKRRKAIKTFINYVEGIDGDSLAGSEKPGTPAPVTSALSQIKLPKQRIKTVNNTPVTENKKGLWDNIHAKQERIKNGSGEHMRKPGSKGAPSAADLKASQTTEETESQYKINKTPEAERPGYLGDDHNKKPHAHFQVFHNGEHIGNIHSYTSHKKIKYGGRSLTGAPISRWAYNLKRGHHSEGYWTGMSQSKTVKDGDHRDDGISTKAVALDYLKAVHKRHLKGDSVGNPSLSEETENLEERGADSKGFFRPTEKGAGLTKKGVSHFRAANPGSKLQTAVTGKVTPGSKDANRRKSFCARMGGMPGPMKDEKGRSTRKAMSLRRWKCKI